MPSTQQRKMVSLDVVETSGVDHPAHLQEGWLVCKSATGQDLTSLFGLNTEGSTMPETKAASETPATKAAGPTVEELQATIADLKKQIADGADKKKANPFAKSAEEIAADEEEVLKALPASVRDMLEKNARETEDLRKSAAADRENFEKERDARLDQVAIAEAQATYKSVAIDAASFAPALRRIEAISPDLAKSVKTALAAADVQLSTAGLFKEVGKEAAETSGSALDRITQKAAELRATEAGKDLTEAGAFAKAVTASPELYREYLAEQGK